jgi:hypothetical protein
MFALGNSTFESFCGMGVKCNEKLLNLGAKNIYELGKGDAF